MAEALAFIFAIVLMVLVFGKLRGSDTIRVLAWFLFFYFLGIVAAIVAYVRILSHLVGAPITVSNLYILHFVLGEVSVGLGISYRPVAWTRRTMKRRLPTKSGD